MAASIREAVVGAFQKLPCEAPDALIERLEELAAGTKWWMQMRGSWLNHCDEQRHKILRKDGLRDQITVHANALETLLKEIGPQGLLMLYGGFPCDYIKSFQDYLRLFLHMSEKTLEHTTPREEKATITRNLILKTSTAWKEHTGQKPKPRSRTFIAVVEAVLLETGLDATSVESKVRRALDGSYEDPDKVREGQALEELKRLFREYGGSKGE